MPLNEYPSGTAFPGVIGRTADESTPAWPPLVRAPKGAPNVLFIVLDDTGFGRWAATAARSRRRTSTAWPSRGCATTTCTRRRCARRAARAFITGRNHHSNAMACITEAATGYPGLQRPGPVRERVPVGDAARARLQHVHDRQVASDPASQETAAGP